MWWVVLYSGSSTIVPSTSGSSTSPYHMLYIISVIFHVDSKCIAESIAAFSVSCF